MRADTKISIEKYLAEKLLEKNIIQFSLDTPYMWTSGKQSPVYCDNRKLLGYPDIRAKIKQAFLNYIDTHCPKLEAIAAVATAGIPYGTMIADTLHKPFVYVRQKPKAHGLRKCIEGELSVPSSLVLVEDLVSTGKSSLRAFHTLQEEGHSIHAILAIFSYGLESQRALFQKHRIPLYVLCNYAEVLKVAEQKQYFTRAQRSQLERIFID